MDQPSSEFRKAKLRTVLLGGNVFWLSLVSLLNDAASEIIYPLLPFFLVTTLGAGPAFLGVLEGIAESVSSFLKLGSGWLSDRVGRRKPLVSSGYGLAALARPLIAVATAPWHVLVIRVADRIGKGLRSAPRDALLAASVDPHVRGTAFGLHRAADHAGAVAGPLLASGLLLVFAGELRTVFALAAVPGIVAALLVVWKVREAELRNDDIAASVPAFSRTGEQTVSSGHAESDRLPESQVSRGLGRSFFAYLAILVIFTLGNATDAFLLLRAGQLGVPLAAIPLLWGVHHVSKMVWNLLGGMLSDRYGPRRSIVAGWLLYAGTYAAFAYATSAWHVWTLFIVYGLFYGLTEAPEKVLIAILVPAHRRGAGFGAYHFAIGIAALPASVLFGVLWSAFGPHIAFLTGAGFALTAALLLTLLVRPRTSAIN